MTTQTPVIQLTPIGTNYPALSIPGVDQIRGVLIDNPSGAWLLLRTTGDFIAPYTIGFARSFDVGRTSIAIEYMSSGPAGQVSTLAGDPARVILSSDPVGNASGNSSGGTAFIEQFTPLNNFVVSEDVGVLTGVVNQVCVAGIANKRVRIMRLTVSSFGIYGVGGAFQWSESPTDCLFRSTTTLTTIARVNLAPRESEPIDGPIDLPLGEGLNRTLLASWANTHIITSVLYQVI